MTRTATSPLHYDLWPSAKLTLIVRFDEFADGSVQRAAPPKPINVLKGTGSQLAPLVAQADPEVPGGLRLVPRGQSQTPQGGPQEQQGSQDGYTQVVAAVIPKRFTWNQNGPRAGDTLSATIRFVDCPVDPRLVRSCAVKLYFGTVDSDEHARGAAGETRTAQAGDTQYAEPLNVIPDEYLDDDGNPRTNLRFEGFVDSKWEITFDEDAEPVIELECLDNTHLMVNIEAPPKLTIDPKLPIDQAVARYLANFPSMQGLTVQYRPTTTPDSWPSDLSFPPTLQGALAGTAYQPQLGPVPSKGGGAVEKLSVWDYITDAVSALGHNVYVDGTTVVITQVVTLMSNQTARRADDPFQGRTVDGESFQYRRMLWGRNLSKMVMRRSFTKRLPTNIEVRSYSTRRKQDLVVRYPDPVTQKDLLQAAVPPGTGGNEQKWMVWKAGANISSTSVLKLIAQNIYQSLGRMQFEVELSTQNLGSYGARTMDPDLLDMKAGDSVEVLVVRDPLYEAVTATEDSLLSSASQAMSALGFSREWSDAAARAYVNAGFQTVYRLRSMSVEWDPEDDEAPVQLELHLVNYVEVRADAPFQPGNG